MDIFLPNILLYYAVAVGVLLSVYGVGRLFVQLCPEWNGENELSNTFFSYMIGAILLIGTFALVWTRGNSIYLLLPITIVLYLWWRKSDNSNKPQLNFKKEGIYFGVSIAIFTAIFVLFYYLLFVRSNGEVFFDLIYYADVTKDMVMYHHESVLRTEISIAQPYHWHEHWLTAMVASICNLNYLYVLLLIIYPFFLMLCICGFAAFASHFKSIPVSLCFCLGLLGVVFWNISSLITPWHGEAMINLPKSYIMTSVLLFGAMYYLQNRINQAFAAMMIICAVYSPLIPGLLTLVVLWSCVYYAHQKKSLGQTVFNKYAIGAVVVAICILAFYGLQPKVLETDLILRHGDNWLKDVVMFIIKQTARPIAIMAPVFCLSYLIYFRKNRQYWTQYLWVSCSVLLSCVAAIVISAFVRQVQLDGGQIASNYYECICNIYVFGSITGLVAYLCSKINKTYIYITIPLLTILYSLHVVAHVNDNLNIVKGEISIEEQEQYRIIKDHISSHPVLATGYVRNYNVPENKNTHKSRHDLIFPMDKMVHVIPDGYYRPHCLSVFDLPEDLDPLWNDSQTSELYQFALKQGTTEDNNLLIQDFVYAMGINYIVVEKEAELPASLINNSQLIAAFNGDRLYEIINIE